MMLAGIEGKLGGGIVCTVVRANCNCNTRRGAEQVHIAASPVASVNRIDFRGVRNAARGGVLLLIKLYRNQAEFFCPEVLVYANIELVLGLEERCGSRALSNWHRMPDPAVGKINLA